MGSELSIQGINTYYGYSHVLHNVSLEVPKKTVVALLGRNGVGKTTTLRSVMGLTPAKSGRIMFKDEDITRVPPHMISRKGVGYVPQGRRLFNSLTVKEHLTVYHRKGTDGKDAWTPERVLEFFPRLQERYSSKGGELSGGERQMLAIARALVTNPNLIVLDEPTEGLAPLVVAEVGQLILKVKDEGFSILLTEQKLRFALSLADDVYLMSKGQIVFHAPPQELDKNEKIKKLYLGL